MATTETAEKSNPFSNLSERERKLVTLMLINFIILAVAAGIYFFKTSQDETRAQIEQYEKTLDTLQEYGPIYIAQQKAQDSTGDDNAQRFSAETLKNNRLKLTSFVATHASAVDLKIDNYDEDQLPLSAGNKDGGPIITENQIKIDIKEGEMDKVILLLDRIEKSKEPVIIKRINLRELRNKPGQVRANLVISTFLQKDQAS